MIHFKYVCLFLFFLLFVSSVNAESYINLERTETGELEPNYSYALQFDGTNDYVNCSTNVDFDTEDWTCELWIRPNELGRFQHVAGKLEEWNDQRWEIRQIDTNKIQANIYDISWLQKNSITTVEIGVWYHVIMLRDGITIRLYINGVQENSGTITVDDTFSGTKDFHLAKYPVGSSYYNGTFDEVRVYTRAINTTEISYSYNAGVGRHTPLNQTSLVLWYHMNEGSGTMVTDSTEENNDGDLNGDTDEWVTGKVPSEYAYPENIIISDLENLYQVKLFNSTNGLIVNGTANSQGQATLTLPSGYRSSSFEGSYRIYNENGSFLFSKWFEDITGGDQLEAISSETALGLGVIALVLALFGLALVLSKYS